jgi:hypothetical protein
MNGGSVSRASKSKHSGPKSFPQLLWSYVVPAYASSPTFVDKSGNLYFAQMAYRFNADDQSRNIFSLSPGGILRWQLSNLNTGWYSEAALDDIGRLFVSPCDGTYFGDAGGTIRAYNTTNAAQIWSVARSSCVDDILYYNNMLFTKEHLVTQKIVSYNATSGSVLWTYSSSIPAAIGSRLALHPNGTLLYVSTGMGLLLIRAYDGTVISQSNTPSASGMMDPCVSSSGIVFTGSQAAVLSFYPDLTTRWTFLLPFARKGGSNSCKCALDATVGALYAACDDILYSISSISGTLNWAYVPAPRTSIYILSYVTVGGDSTIYFSSSAVFAFNANGTALWNISLNAPMSREPTISANGTLFLNDGTRRTIYAYQ